MTYNQKGLGIAEMTFISVNYPQVWHEIDQVFDDNQDGLQIARQFIEVYNKDLIGGLK